tara:strand:- start:1944 stop:2429 length:486 start_codon:yes stop_codon:yes gene_type:complete
MIRPIGHNDVVEAISLMSKSEKENNYLNIKRKDSKWIAFFLNHVHEQSINNPNFLAIGHYEDNKEGNLNGFLLASSFSNHYNDDVIMDVKDCIVDSPDNQRATYITIMLFNELMDHIRKHGGSKWRADSIRDDKSQGYAKLLRIKYNADICHSAHGKINET